MTTKKGPRDLFDAGGMLNRVVGPTAATPRRRRPAAPAPAASDAPNPRQIPAGLQTSGTASWEEKRNRQGRLYAWGQLSNWSDDRRHGAWCGWTLRDDPSKFSGLSRVRVWHAATKDDLAATLRAEGLEVYWLN